MLFLEIYNIYCVGWREDVCKKGVGVSTVGFLSFFDYFLIFRRGKS
jgi:hypothetical protein